VLETSPEAFLDDDIETDMLEVEYLDSEIETQNDFDASALLLSSESKLFEEDVELNENPNNTLPESNETVALLCDSLGDGSLTTIDNKSTKITQRAIKTLRTDKKNRGEAFSNCKGNAVRAKEFKRLPECTKKCNERISADVQETLFNQYWALGKYDKRLSYLSQLIVSKSKTKVLVNPKKIRLQSFDYNVNVEDSYIKVCKTCFVKIFDETRGFINTVCTRITTIGEVVTKDHRGGARRNLTQQQLQDTNDHIASYPSYVSHYCRPRTTFRYLSRELTIAKMHHMYKETYQNPVSLSKYQKIFKSKKLRFKKYKTDTCNKCDSFVHKIRNAKSKDEELTLIQERDFHQKIANDGYEQKRLDKNNPDKIVLCFDLQQCLPTPYISSNFAFYKRQLWTFNLTIHDCSTGTFK
jgi:hypothetical protein